MVEYKDHMQDKLVSNGAIDAMLHTEDLLFLLLCLGMVNCNVRPSLVRVLLHDGVYDKLSAPKLESFTTIAFSMLIGDWRRLDVLMYRFCQRSGPKEYIMDIFSYDCPVLFPYI